MENIKCIFCNIENDDVFIKENGYLGRKCQTCNLIYISPRPSFSDIVNLYSHDDANLSASNHINNSFTAKLYANQNLKYIRRYIKKGKMLEIGAGAGYFLNEARKTGFDVYGIEFNKIQANFINNELNIPCEQSPLSEQLFNNEKFDVIYHCDVISHLYDPISEFEKMRDKLNKNGFVIFETGNLGDVKNSYFKYFTKFQYPDHLFFYSGANIKNLLEQTGFELIKIHRFSIFPQLFIIKTLLKLVNYIKPKKKLENTQVGNTNRVNKDEKESGKGILKGKFLKNSYAYFIYLIRYKLGSIVPKQGRPQTILVIAKKK